MINIIESGSYQTNKFDRSRSYTPDAIRKILGIRTLNAITDDLLNSLSTDDLIVIFKMAETYNSSALLIKTTEILLKRDYKITGF